ncbi:MAG: acyl carrier protein [Paludibacter sp.]
MESIEILTVLESFINNDLGKKNDNLSLDTKIKDLGGWDSLTNIKFTVLIETKYNIKFSIREVIGWKTLNDVIGNIIKKSL